MSFEQNPTRAKQRLVILLVGVVGLAAAAILFLIYDSVKKPSQLAIKAPAQSTPAPSEAIPATVTSVVDASTLVPEQQEPTVAAAPKASKKNSRSGSSRRKQVAMKFPAPPVGGHNADWLAGPKSEVEMWAGDRRSVIWVPPAPKTQEAHHHESQETFY
jgi:cell division protein FtsI/penicillin-binding protein 2